MLQLLRATAPKPLGLHPAPPTRPLVPEPRPLSAGPSAQHFTLSFSPAPLVPRPNLLNSSVPPPHPLAPQPGFPQRLSSAHSAAQLCFLSHSVLLPMPLSHAPSAQLPLISVHTSSVLCPSAPPTRHLRPAPSALGTSTLLPGSLVSTGPSKDQPRPLGPSALYSQQLPPQHAPCISQTPVPQYRSLIASAPQFPTPCPVLQLLHLSLCLFLSSWVGHPSLCLSPLAPGTLAFQPRLLAL